MSTATDQILEVCIHCGLGRHPVTQCPRVAAVNFDAYGLVTRVEYHPPAKADVRMTCAYCNQPIGETESYMPPRHLRCGAGNTAEPKRPVTLQQNWMGEPNR